MHPEGCGHCRVQQLEWQVFETRRMELLRDVREVNAALRIAGSAATTAPLHTAPGLAGPSCR